MRGFVFFQAEDGIRDADVTGVQTCALPILPSTSTCRLRISRSAIPTFRICCLDRRGGGPTDAARLHARSFGPRLALRGRAVERELDQLRKRRLLERPDHAALDTRPEQPRRAVLESIELVVAEHAHLFRVGEALHR